MNEFMDDMYLILAVYQINTKIMDDLKNNLRIISFCVGK